MAVYRKNGRAYGISSPTIGIPQESIISSRIPTSNDRAEIGTIWVYQDGTGAGDDIYILSSVIANTAYWISLGGGTGTFESLVISGTSTLTGAVSIGGIFDVNSTGAVTVDGTTIDLSGSGAVTIDSSAGTIGIGVDDIDQAINIGTTGERTITIGNQVGAAGIVIESGTSAMALNASGLISVEVVTDSQAAAAVTLNVNAGHAVFTGLTTAAAASQVFTITNSLCTATSAILCTMANLGANDAQMTITRVIPDAGSFTVTGTNNGAAALNGNVHITFWILDAAV